MDPLHPHPLHRLPLFRRREPLLIAQNPVQNLYTPLHVIDPEVASPDNIMGTKSSKPFTPTYMDVCAARAALKSLNLPTELVLQILDHARYWPIHDFTGSNVSVSSNRADIALLECIYDRANNIPAIFAGGEALKIKEVEFIIKSKDQGWTSEGTEGMFDLLLVHT
jgi:hypothetical protein